MFHSSDSTLSVSSLLRGLVALGRWATTLPFCVWFAGIYQAYWYLPDK